MTHLDKPLMLEGKRAQFPILGDIAAQVGLTKRQVRARLSSAASKITSAIKEAK